LARIQVSPTLGPLAETVLALALLRCSRQPRNMLSEWRGQVRVTPRMRPLAALIPPDCNGVDLPTLVGETATIEQGVQALLDVPREHLLVEMDWIDRRDRLPPRARGGGLDRPAPRAPPAGGGDGGGGRAPRAGRGDPGRLPGADPAVLAPHP